MPPAEVELGHCDKALDRVVDLGQREERLGVGHEAVVCQHLHGSGCGGRSLSYFVMRSSIDRGSRIKVGSVTRLRSAPGRSCDMIWESTAMQHCVSQLLLHVQLLHVQLFRLPL